jgi:general secretion pathway protein B
MPGPDLASTPAAAVAQTPSPLVPAARATAVPASAPNGLNVSGATYSDNPAHRMLIINGKVVAEGQEVEPGLVLEVITPRSAVLNRGGSRFNINY